MHVDTASMQQQQQPSSQPQPLTAGRYNTRLLGDQVIGINDTILPCAHETAETLCQIGSQHAGTQIVASINCTLTPPSNVLSGWYAIFPGSTPVHAVPFPTNMFDGITVVETLATEQQILDLLKQRSTMVEKLQAHARKLRSNVATNRASWQRCRPDRGVPLQRKHSWKVVMRQENVSRFITIQHPSPDNGGKNNVKLSADAPFDCVPDDSVLNYVDSAPWDPELSDDSFVGLYHQWYGSTDGKPVLKLYFVCQSCCQKAGLEIKQMLNNLPRHVSLSVLAKSEEIWWLRNANARNRNRLIYSFASALGIQIPLADDLHASDTAVKMAHPLTESLLYSLYEYRDGRVGVANECMPTCFMSNGIVCRMAPWTGVSIFHGPPSTEVFGGAFGTETTVFPLTTVKLNPQAQQAAKRLHCLTHCSRPGEHAAVWHDGGKHAAAADTAAATAAAEAAAAATAAQESAIEHELETLLAHDTDTGFVGIDDPELDAIALSAWKQARLDNRCKRQEVLDAAGMAKRQNDQHTQTDHQASYINFNDDNIICKLKRLQWDPRYGMLQLLPLAVCTF